MKCVSSFTVALLIAYSACGQNANSFSQQLANYNSFIGMPITLPKKTDNVIVDVSKNNLYLNYLYNKGNFYLDADNIAWGGNWFAWADGGMATRWQENTPPTTINGKKVFCAAKGELNKDYWSKVEKMSTADIAALSPIEKYDIYACDKGLEFFWASNQELIARGPYKLPALDAQGKLTSCNFCGFCNGARVSGALMPEPIHDVVVKAKGHPEIEVTFHPADLKALSAASFYYLDQNNILNIGSNYDANLSKDENKKSNPNPAVFDIILRQYLSTYKVPLFIDVQYNSEIWNETILGFDRQIKAIKPLRAGMVANAKAVQSVLVECTLYCQDEVSIDKINGKTTQIMANKALAVKNGWVRERKYRYRLFTDKTGTILDGAWDKSYLDVSRANEPVRMAWVSDMPVDFIWLAKGEGADDKHVYSASDASTANYTGNSNIKFEDILALVKIAAK